MLYPFFVTESFNGPAGSRIDLCASWVPQISHVPARSRMNLLRRRATEAESAPKRLKFTNKDNRVFKLFG